MAEKNVTQALAAVMAEVRGVGKDGFHDAPGAKFKFRGIDAIVNAVGPAMRNHGVIVTPQLVDVTRRDVSTSQGKASRETCVIVKYIFTGPDGTTLETIVPGEAMDSADKGTAKAMSVAFRIALLQALCLPTDDADPDSHHYERGHQQQSSQPPQQRSNGQQQRPAQAAQETPVEPPPAAGPPKNATEARTQLAKTCADSGWDLDIVAARFLEIEGMELGQATDRDLIVRFRASLFAVSDDELRKQPAANGATAR